MTSFAFGFNNPQFSDYQLELVSLAEDVSLTKASNEESDFEPLLKSMSDMQLARLLRSLRRELISRKKRKPHSTSRELATESKASPVGNLAAIRSNSLVEGHEIVDTPLKEKKQDELKRFTSPITPVSPSVTFFPSAPISPIETTNVTHSSNGSISVATLRALVPLATSSAASVTSSPATTLGPTATLSSAAAPSPSTAPSSSSASSSTSASGSAPSAYASSSSSSSTSNGTAVATTSSHTHAASVPLCCPAWPREKGSKNEFLVALDDDSQGGEAQATFPINSLVLSAASPFFRTVIEQCANESKTVQVHVEQRHWPIFNKVLQSIYDMGISIVDVDEAVALLLLAEKFQVDKVRKAVVAELSRKTLSLEDARTLLQLPDAFFSCPELGPFRAQCGDIFAEYVQDFDAFLEGRQVQLMTSAELLALLRSDALRISSEDSTWQAVALWCSVHEPDHHTVSRFCQALRFPLINPGYIHDVIIRSEVAKLFPEVVMPYITFGLGFSKFSHSRQKIERKFAPEHWFKARVIDTTRLLQLRFHNARKLAEQATCKTHAMVLGYDLVFYLHRMKREFSLTIGSEAGREEAQGFKRLIALKVQWGAIAKKCELGAAWGVKLIALNRSVDSVVFEQDDSLLVELSVTAQSGA